MDPWPAFLDTVSAAPFHHGVCLSALDTFVTVENPLAAGLCSVDPFSVGICHYTVGSYGKDRFSDGPCLSNGDSLGADILDPLADAYYARRIYDRGDHYGNGGPSMWCHMASAYGATRSSFHLGSCYSTSVDCYRNSYNFV